MDCNNPQDMREEWACKAIEKNGSPVIWIDQSHDTALQEIDSEGVCFAITRDWVRNYRCYRIDRFKFVNSFREAATEDPEQRIPFDYIFMQDEYASELRQNRNQIRQISLDLAKRKLNGDPPPDNLLKTLLTIRKNVYGPELQNFTEYKLDEVHDVAYVLQEMKAIGATTPSYFMLTLRRKGGGHVVGFEFRPDVHVSSRFPGLFEFIDANLGLYAFPAVDNLIDFFNEDVWTELYHNNNYTSFELAQFNTGIGGLSKTWTEWLNDLVAWFKSWLPSSSTATT